MPNYAFPVTAGLVRVTGYGAHQQMSATLAQSFTPTPDPSTLRSRLAKYGHWLAVESLPDGGTYTAPATGCAWWARCNSHVYGQLQATAATARAAKADRRQGREGTTITDPTAPTPTPPGATTKVALVGAVTPTTILIAK
jgi:hypothetical protein